MNLKDLQKTIPYQWRVQSFSKSKPSATCVAYIDARDVMNLLDEVVSPENWQDSYQLVGDQLVAGIGIRTEHGWVWKYDTGVESNTEAEKGQFSDAFKRAAVKWGVGRFLYSLKIQYVNTNEVKKQNTFPYPVDKNGNKIYDLTEHLNKEKPAQQKKNWFANTSLEKKSTETEVGPSMTCKVHGAHMYEQWSAKKQTTYFAHKHEGKWCFGKDK